MRDRLVTLRPHLSCFLRRLSVELNTSRVAVRVGLFTRNTQSYAMAVAEQILRPLMSVPLAFVFGGAHCRGKDRRGKSLTVTGHPATSLLVDDSCASFVADEFFGGRGALVRPFFTGAKPWGPEEEMDDVFLCTQRRAFFDLKSDESRRQFSLLMAEDMMDYSSNGEEEGGDVSLSVLLEEFVAFWHNNNYDFTEEPINLLKDPRAEQYQKCWYGYHVSMEERLLCIE